MVVLSCSSVLVDGACPLESQVWIEQPQSTFDVPTAEEFVSALPDLITILFIAYVFRTLTRMIWNR